MRTHPRSSSGGVEDSLQNEADKDTEGNSDHNQVADESIEDSDKGSDSTDELYTDSDMDTSGISDVSYISDDSSFSETDVSDTVYEEEPADNVTNDNVIQDEYEAPDEDIQGSVSDAIIEETAEEVVITEEAGDDGEGETTETYAIRIGDMTNGTATIEDDLTEATEGKTISFTVTANDGYTAGKPTVINGENAVEVSGGSGSYSFIMPAGEVMISCVFAKGAQASTLDDGEYPVNLDILCYDSERTYQFADFFRVDLAKLVVTTDSESEKKRIR